MLFLHELKIDDFESRAYQHILQVLQTLDNNNYSLESILIENKIDEKAQASYIEIIATNPVVNIEPYVKMLKENKARRDLRLLATKLINQDDEKDLDKTVAKIEQLQQIKSATTTQKFDISFLKDKKLTALDIKKTEFDYLYQNFIVKGELTMIAAKPASGKSLTTVALANHALNYKKVETVIYFDMDNSITTLKQRAINQLLDNHQNNFIYLHSSKNTKQEIFRYIKKFQNMDLTNRLIIFDSAKNFMMGGDRDKNKDVSKLTDIFKSLRDKGATVVFLHHTNKPSKDLEELVYSGSSAWEEDTTNAFLLNKNEYKDSFIFKPFKARVGDLHAMAFKYNDNHTLTLLDFSTAIITEEDEEIKDEIINYLKENAQDPEKRAYTRIWMSIQKFGFSKNKIQNVLKIFEDKHWTAIKQAQNNRTVYTVIRSKEPAITTFNEENINQTPSIQSVISNQKNEKMLGQLDNWTSQYLSHSQDNSTFGQAGQVAAIQQQMLDKEIEMPFIS